MTTASGSTTSSPDTQSTQPSKTVVKPLEEAPFSEYLRILRENNHAEDAEVSEAFYIPLLTGVDLGGGRILTKEQVYALSFKKVTELAEILLKEMGRQIAEAMPPPTVAGPILKGEGADKLSPEQLDYLMRRQLQLTEEEKMRLG